MSADLRVGQNVAVHAHRECVVSKAFGAPPITQGFICHSCHILPFQPIL